MNREFLSVFVAKEVTAVTQRFEIYLHQRMGESNFGTVDGPIPCCFDDGEVIGVLGVENDCIYNIL